MNRFDFEDLDVFQAAVELAVSVDPIAEQLPPGRAYIRDQLRRAANSIPLNIAEGAGEFAPREKSRFYRMAKRSATEAAAQLIVAEQLGLTSDSMIARPRELLHRLVSMLVRMISTCERRFT